MKLCSPSGTSGLARAVLPLLPTPVPLAGTTGIWKRYYRCFWSESTALKRRVATGPVLPLLGAVLPADIWGLYKGRGLKGFSFFPSRSSLL